MGLTGFNLRRRIAAVETASSAPIERATGVRVPGGEARTEPPKKEKDGQKPKGEKKTERKPEAAAGSAPAADGDKNLF